MAILPGKVNVSLSGRITWSSTISLPVLYNGGKIHDTLYSENNLQFISPLTSDITKDMESVWLKHGPDITNNVPPNMEASFGVIVNVP
jgi:hypothetical protein